MTTVNSVKPSGRKQKVTPLREDSIMSAEAFGEMWNAHPESVASLNNVYLEAQLYLRGRDLETCHEMIRSALASAAVESDPNRVAAVLSGAATSVRSFLEERAEQTARRVYATSLYWGVAISAGILVGVTLVLLALTKWFLGADAIPDSTMSVLRNVVVCLGGGAAGAVVSTILRVSNVDKIDYRVVTLRTAAFRIVLGWLFAAAVLFLIKGTIVTVFNVPTDEASAESLFFWAGIGFLAGFNEMWAKNLVTRNPSDTPPEN